MTALDLLGLGLLGLRTRPARAVLSALGIAIGIATMVVVTCIPASSSAALMRELSALGTNMLQATAPEAQTPMPEASVAMVERIAPVLRLLVTRLDTPTITGAWLADAMGRPRPLPMALRRDLAETRASALLDAGERRLRALPEALGAWAFPLAAWRALDPELATLRDVDAPGDL